MNDLDPRTHNFLRYGREIQTSIIMVGAAMGFLNDAFGGGVGANVAFAGKASAVMETQLTGDPQIPLSQATMDLSIAPSAIAGIYLSPGRIFSAVDGLEFGASYRMETKMKIDPFNAAAILFNGTINMNLMLAIVDFYTPHTVTAGVAYTRWDVTLSADVNWEIWSKNYISKVLKFHYMGLPKFEDTFSYKVGIRIQHAGEILRPGSHGRLLLRAEHSRQGRRHHPGDQARHDQQQGGHGHVQLPRQRQASRLHRH